MYVSYYSKQLTFSVPKLAT